VTLAGTLNAALGVEEAAVYSYGVVGARLQGLPDERAAQRGFDAHRARRATLTALVAAAGATPVAAATAYDVGPVPTPAAAQVLAATVEATAADAYAQLVAAATGSTRQLAASWLADAAVRGTGWSDAPPTFPGLSDQPPG
jgi:hypothetical protein